MAFIVYLIKKRRCEQIKSEGYSWRYYLKDIENPFELPEQDFISCFTLSKEATRSLIYKLKPYLTIAKNGYAIEIQVLSTLQILATGRFQKDICAVGVLPKMSQASASRFFDSVISALLRITKQFIRFPVALDEIHEACKGFYEKFNFPNVIGAVDCTHVHINKPSSDAMSFMNRKKKYSLNVQMVCDSNQLITDIVAKWPGSTLDSFIWTSSEPRHLLSSGAIEQPVFLLGDIGYPLEKWLMTPYREPSCAMEKNFNKKHCSASNVIRQCFGALKSKFRILSDDTSVLLYSPEKCCKIIIAAAILHNVCLLHNVTQPESLPLSDYIDNEDVLPVMSDDDADAAILRNKIAAYFQRRE